MKIKDNGGSKTYGRKEGMGASVIAHSDSPPVFEPAKHNFNLMPLFIQVFIVRNRLFSVLFGRDAGRNALGKQGGTKPVSVITTIRQKLPGIREGIYKLGGSFVVTDLAFCERHDQGPAVTITNGMEFRVQTAFCAPDAAGKSPFLSKLAAVRWALR